MRYAYCALRAQQEGLWNREPRQPHGCRGPRLFQLKCYSTFDGLKNTAIQPVKQPG